TAGAAAAPLTPAGAAAGAGSSSGGGTGGGGALKLTLAEFMSGRPVSAPLQVVGAGGQRGREQEREREPAGPAWGGVPGSSPRGARSLLDIQAEQAQVQKRAAANWGKTAPPGTSTAGPTSSSSAAASTPAAAAACPLGSSPPVGRSPLPLPLLGLSQPPPAQPSKWYVPEQCQPAVAAKPLSAIQIEERAIKEISARYSGKVVARVVTQDYVAEGPTAGTQT
ncbi:hypothetical protein Agub_g611, partial [Astrephomene gubernaculifera]